MMENRDGEIHVETDEARGGSSPNIVRWVLGIGLLLAIVGMSLAWIIPAANHGPETMQSQNAQRNIEGAPADQGKDTDSIITPEQANPNAAGAPAAAPSEGAVPAVANNADSAR
jgi:hypothetical protein